MCLDRFVLRTPDHAPEVNVATNAVKQLPRPYLPLESTGRGGYTLCFQQQVAVCSGVAAHGRCVLAQCTIRANLHFKNSITHLFQQPTMAPKVTVHSERASCEKSRF